MKNEKGSGIRPGTFKRLMAYLFSHYRVQLITVILCIIITAVASVGQTVYIQILIDQCILPGVESGMASVWPQMRSIFTSMAVIYAVGVLASLVYTRIMATVTQGTLKNFRVDMFTRMQTLPVKYFDTHAHGDIMSTYTNDTDAIRMMVSQSMPMLVQSILTILVMIVMMTRFSIPMFVVVCLFVAGMLTVTKKFGGMSSRYMMFQQRSLAAEEGFVEEMMAGQKVVQVFCH